MTKEKSLYRRSFLFQVFYSQEVESMGAEYTDTGGKLHIQIPNFRVHYLILAHLIVANSLQPAHPTCNTPTPTMSYRSGGKGGRASWEGIKVPAVWGLWKQKEGKDNTRPL